MIFYISSTPASSTHPPSFSPPPPASPPTTTPFNSIPPPTPPLVGDFQLMFVYDCIPDVVEFVHFFGQGMVN